MMWDIFKRLFKENYFNADHRQSIADEFESFYQDSMIVTNFYNRFIELAQYAQVGVGDTPALIAKFRKRL